MTVDGPVVHETPRHNGHRQDLPSRHMMAAALAHGDASGGQMDSSLMLFSGEVEKVSEVLKVGGAMTRIQ